MHPTPLPDAVLVKPGSALEEVKEQLARDRVSRPSPERGQGLDAARRRLTDEVRAAFEDEAPQIVERHAVERHAVERGRELSRPVTPPAPADSDPDAVANGAEVRHRLGARPTSSAARIITLRDRRRGRPRRDEGGHGSDPPR